MRLKITARELLITKIQDSDGRVSVIFSPDTKVEPKDIFALRGKSGVDMRFQPDGFDLDLKSFSRKEVYRYIAEIMHELKKSAPLLV
jgi:transcription-repair coupling factor (superfamily II helicase)